jgi:hypothetical protein
VVSYTPRTKYICFELDLCHTLPETPPLLVSINLIVCNVSHDIPLATQKYSRFLPKKRSPDHGCAAPTLLVADAICFPKEMRSRAHKSSKAVSVSVQPCKHAAKLAECGSLCEPGKSAFVRSKLQVFSLLFLFPKPAPLAYSGVISRIVLLRRG